MATATVGHRKTNRELFGPRRDESTRCANMLPHFWDELSSEKIRKCCNNQKCEQTKEVRCPRIQMDRPAIGPTKHSDIFNTVYI